MDEYIFRGGQPAAEAWPGLAKLGVKTVIDLRRADEPSKQALHEAKSFGMGWTQTGLKSYVNRFHPRQ